MEIEFPVNYEPRWYQQPLWQFIESGGTRAVAVWHRRAGKDLNAINIAATLSMQKVGLYWHLFPTYAQGKKIAWDGKTRDGKPFLNAFPESLIVSKNNTEMKITLSTGQIYQVVGADKPDSLVGANPIGVILSEWSLMNPKIWDLIQPILAENGGWAIFIFTPRGKNHAYKMLQMAKKNPKWFAEVLPNSVTKVIHPDAVQEMRDSGMSDEMVAQEIECSFEAPVEGSYYGKLINKAEEEGRVCSVPWEPKLLVNTSWDLGMNDSMSIWFYQRYGFEVRIIDYYQNSGEGLQHYAKILREKDYVYDRHFAPHDIEVRELSDGKSRREKAKALGIRFEVGKQHEILDGIEQVRSTLPMCWFDEKKTEFGLECLKQYHKEWDEVRAVFRDNPAHDWSSHAADSFRELAWSLKNRPKKKSVEQTVAQSDYDMMGI
jgi:phage terminase large subunit